MVDEEPTRLDLSALRRVLVAAADPAEAASMARYMKDQFAFLGVKSPARRRTAKPTIAAGGHASADELTEFARECWQQPEREFQYTAVDVLRRWIDTLGSPQLADLEWLITTKSWWDTVDGLAAWCVGPLIARDPALVAVMDEWIESDDIWLARTAILYQLGYKDATDSDRLFRYATTRAGDTEFFIRKAIGWALRQYARVDPTAVEAFVVEHEAELTGLTKREALKRIGAGS